MAQSHSFRLSLLGFLAFVGVGFAAAADLAARSRPGRLPGEGPASFPFPSSAFPPLSGSVTEGSTGGGGARAFVAVLQTRASPASR